MRTLSRNWLSCAIGLLALSAVSLRADQLQMQNGDRYIGKILSVTSNSVVLQSEVLGKVTLPREKVSSLSFGTTAAAVPASSAPGIPAITTTSPRLSGGTNADLSAAFQSLNGNTNFIQQIRQQMLAGSTPEANQKYDELVGGLMSGKMSVNDLRNEAKTSIDQINQLKRELGPEADESLNSYLAILQNFVNEAEATPTSTPATTNQNAILIK